MVATNPVELWRDVVLPALIAAGPEVAYPGVELKHRHGRQWRGGCPFHDGESSTTFVVDVETLKWQCWGGCGGGDPLTYHCGGQTPTGGAFVEAVKELAELAGVVWPETKEAALKLKAAAPPRPRARRRSVYPPAEEVLELWRGAQPVDADKGAAAWLRSRGLSPNVVAERDLARVLRRGSPCPSWARYWGPWSRGPYRLVVPLWDAEGRLRSLHARAITPPEEGRPKAVSTASIKSDAEEQRTTTRGLVMADELGRQLLELGELPAWWPQGRVLRAIVCEGEPDWLTWATRFGELAEAAPAVLGIIGGGRSGSWTDAIARRIPAGSRIIIRTDCDDAGEGYARSIASSLKACRILRRRHCETA